METPNVTFRRNQTSLRELPNDQEQVLPPDFDMTSSDSTNELRRSTRTSRPQEHYGIWLKD